MQLTSFVGRVDDLKAIAARLDSARLVTLVGSGGAGKSRLAVETARRVVQSFPDGVWFVELASTNTETEVLSALSNTLNVPEMQGHRMLDVLADTLAEKRMLVVLDNCDPVTAVVAQVTVTLLERTPEVKILATSRERLGVGPEVLWLVEGLDVPDDPTSRQTAESVQLFVERAAAIDPSFEITASNVEAVIAICRALDGLPLAIELAASRTNTFSVYDIASRLRDALRFLVATGGSTHERHASMASVVEWSYRLLSPEEQVVLRHLGLFAGSFDGSAARYVAGDEREPFVFDGFLSSLVDKSLVVRLPHNGGETRYRLLETVRQFAMARVEEDTSSGLVQRRHAEFYARRAAQLWPSLWTPELVMSLERLAADAGNYRTALRFALTAGDADLAHRMVGVLFRFWDLRGHYAEGLEWLSHVTDMQETPSPTLRVWALNGLATLAVLNGQIERAVEVSTAAAELAANIGDDGGRAYALQYLGFSQMYALDNDGARNALLESVAAADRVGDSWLTGWSSLFLAAVGLEESDVAEVVARVEVARRDLGVAGEQEGLGWCAVADAAGAFIDGRFEGAAAALRASLEFFMPLSDRWGISTAGAVSAGVWLGLGDVERATESYARAELLRTVIGAVHLPVFTRWVEEGCDRCRIELGQVPFQRLWAAARDVTTTDLPDRIDADIGHLKDRAGADGVASGWSGLMRGAVRTVTLREDVDVWTLSVDGVEHRMRPRVGLRHLVALIERPGRQLSAVELAHGGLRSASMREGGVGPEEASAAGGELLDGQAIREFRARVEELESELEEAEAWVDLGRATELRVERDAILEALGAAVGLSGRSRRYPSVAERARSNVTKAIRSAIDRITEADTAVGMHLAASVSTGRFCAYQPDPTSGIRWEVFRRGD